VTERYEHVAEEVAAYVLGSLDASDRTRVEAHLATCAECANLLTEYQAVVGVLPIGLEPFAPPPQAWTTIRAAARARRPRASRWLRVARWPAIAALVALLVIWNVTLERELNRCSPGPAPGPEVEALSRRPGRMIILAGTGAPKASARIFVAVDGGGHLAVSGLASLPRDRAYHLWFVRSGAPAASGATFGVDRSGRAWVKVAPPASLDDVRAIVVTEEPASGSAAPTGRELLVARPWP
jgi:anti-sigma-K factor RskA